MLIIFMVGPWAKNYLLEIFIGSLALNTLVLTLMMKIQLKVWFLEVHLEYPPELHELHNDYPLSPEKMTVKPEMLSDYSREILDREGMTIGKVLKLIPNLMDKEKYVLHYRNLQLYLSLGLKLKKIHRALEFLQSKWFEKYISFNTKMRSQTKNNFLS